MKLEIKSRLSTFNLLLFSLHLHHLHVSNKFPWVTASRHIGWTSTVNSDYSLFHFSALLLWPPSLHACGIPSGEKQRGSSNQLKPRHGDMARSGQALLKMDGIDRSSLGFSPAAEPCPVTLTGLASSRILLAHPAAGTTWSVTLSEHKCKRLSSLARCRVSIIKIP